MKKKYNFIIVLLFIFVQLLVSPVVYGDVLPVVTVENGYPRKVTKGDSLNVSKASAFLGDEKIDGISIALYYSNNQSANYTKVKDLAVDENIVFDKNGTYCIKYEVNVDSQSEGNPYIGQEVFYLSVKDVWPVIVAPSEIAEKAYVNQSFTIPTVKVQDLKGNKITHFTISYKIIFSGNEVTGDGNKFTPTEEGVYNVIYSAEVDGAKAEDVSLTVVVHPDNAVKTGCNSNAFFEKNHMVMIFTTAMLMAIFLRAFIYKNKIK